MPELIGQPVGDRGEASGDDRDGVAEPLERPHEGPRAGGEPDLRSATRSSALHGRARPDSRRVPRSDAAKSSSPVIARRVTVGDLLAAAGFVGEQLDHLVLDERRVDVEHDQPLGAPLEALALDGDVDAVLGRRREQLGCASRSMSPSTTTNSYDDDRVAGEPHDAVDVAAAGRDRPGHRAGAPPA
jgi:hypothetical protein